MGRATTDCLPCLLILIVLSLCPGSSAVKLTITVGPNPVQSGVGWNTILSVANGSDLFSVVWLDPTGSNILTRLNGQIVIKPGSPYDGRVGLQANNSLTIRPTTQRDEGNYTVTMEAPSDVGLTPNSMVLRLEVYEPVTNVSIALSASDVFEGDVEVRLTCSALTGSRVTYTWRKGDSVLSNSSRVTVSGSEVRIQPVSRDDADSYSCTVHNPISTSSHSRLLTVYYGPESAAIQRDFQSDCVVPDQFLMGRSGRLSCDVVSVPVTAYTWLHNGQLIRQESSIPFDSTKLTDSGNYTCIISNAKTNKEITAATQIIIVDYCLSVGAVVGIAIGAAAGLLLLILLIVFLVRRKRAQKNKAVSKPPLKKTPNHKEAKVLPWMNEYPEVQRGISPTPIYSADRMSVYSIYPPSNGSMVASTVDGGVSLFSSQTDRSGQLSTLV